VNGLNKLFGLDYSGLVWITLDWSGLRWIALDYAGRPPVGAVENANRGRFMGQSLSFRMQKRKICISRIASDGLDSTANGGRAFSATASGLENGVLFRVIGSPEQGGHRGYLILTREPLIFIGVFHDFSREVTRAENGPTREADRGAAVALKPGQRRKGIRSKWR